MPNSNRQSQGVYIFQSSTKLYFRQAVPPDLQPTFRKTEIRISLRTGDRREAKRKAAYLSARLWDIFLALRRGDTRMTQLNTEQINELVKQWTEEILAKDEVGRALAEKPTMPSRASDALNALDMNSFYIHEGEQALSRNDYSFFENAVYKLMSAHDIAADRNSAEFRVLCREMVKAFIEIYKIRDQRSQGLYPQQYTVGFGLNTSPLGAATAPREVTAPAKADKTTVDVVNTRQNNINKAQQTRLSKAFKDFVEEKQIHKSWSQGTEKSVSDKIAIFIELVGDIKLCDLTQMTLRDFEKALINYPKNRNKSPKYRNIPTARIKKMTVPDDERISLQTVANYINTINGFLSWLQTMYELPSWTSAILTPPKATVAADTRKARAVFNDTDLHKIFDNPWYVTGGQCDEDTPKRKAFTFNSAKFWLPLLGLFTGARLEELAQLYLADFKIVDGVKCFELSEVIDGENGEVVKVKSLKNLSSRRIVPLHEQLLDLGLWEYVEELKAKGHTRLFEELSQNKTTLKYSHDFSKAFNRWLKSLGIVRDPKEGAKVFYSFRHTFINYCVQHRIEDNLFERVVGHKFEGNEITYSHYAKALSPAILKAEVMDKVDYGMSFEHLKSNPYARERLKE